MRRRWPYLIGVLALIAIAPVLRPSPFTLSDHTIFVEAGRMVLEGRSPYDPSNWDAVARDLGSPFIAMLSATTGVWPHPPWVAYAFVPFALLPRDAGPWALHLVLLASGLGGALLLVGRMPWWSDRIRALALAAGLTFQPLVIGIRWGQLGPLLLLGTALLLIGIERKRTAPLVASALLLLLKPHVLVVLAAVAVVLVIRRVPRAVPPLMGVVVVVCAIPTALDPRWLGAAGSGYATRIDGLAAYATTYALAIDIAPGAWPVVALVLIAIASATCLMTLRMNASGGVDWTIAVAAVLSLVIAPYLWPTDQALLVIVLLLGLLAGDRAASAVRGPHFITVLLGLGILPWALFLISAPRPTQALEAVVPIVASLVLAQSARLSRGAATA